MKRILTLLLMLCLFISAVLPMTAFAAEYETGNGFSVIDEESGEHIPDLPFEEAVPGEPLPEAPEPEAPEIIPSAPDIPESETPEGETPDLELPTPPPINPAQIQERGSLRMSAQNTRSVEQAATFAELQAAVNSAVNGVEKRIEIVADFPFESTINIQHGRIVTIYAYGDYRLTAPANARHFDVSGTLNLQKGIALVGNGGNGGNGGGVSSNGTFNMSGNSAIRNNLWHIEGPVYGGGVQSSGDFTMTDNAVIEGNTIISDRSASYGGGVNFVHGTIVLSGNAAIRNNASISMNSAAYGGGIYQHGGVVHLTDSAEISGNTVRGESGSMAVGGGIHSGYAATLNIFGSAAIRGNEAAGGGGVWISCGGSRLTIADNAAIENNTVTENGGGVSLGIDAAVQMNGGRISGNTAVSGGGINIAVNRGSIANITRGEIIGNTAHQNGGGISAALTDLIVGADAVFSDNQAAVGHPNRNPIYDALYEQNIKGTHWTLPFTQGYNNFDIGSGDIDLTARYSVAYDGNGYTAGSVPVDSNTYIFGGIVTVLDSGDLQRSGHVFAGWNTGLNGGGTSYAAGDTFTIGGNITLFAQWRETPPTPPNTVTITFEGNGGTVLPENRTRQAASGTALGADMPSVNPIRNGFTFSGWNTAQNGSGTSFTSEIIVNADIIVYAQWIQNQEPPTQPQQGRVNITNLSDGSRERLAGGVFGIRDAMSDEEIAKVTTDRFGEAFALLGAGNYYLRQIEAPRGYLLNAERITFRIRANEVTEVTVVNKPVPTAPELPEVQSGSLLVTAVADGSNAKLSGVRFDVFHSRTYSFITGITTDRFGEAFAELPAGDYFLRMTSIPRGYILTTDRISFRIQANRLTEVTVKIKAETPVTPDEANVGYIHLLKKAEGTGERLQGAVFGIFRASDNVKIAEITSDRDGRAAFELTPNDYYLRELTAPRGFRPETARIPFTIKSGETVLVEVTNMREGSAVGAAPAAPTAPASPSETGAQPGDSVIPVQPDGSSSGSNSSGWVEIPQTGEVFPVMSYVLAMVMFGIAAVCSVVLVKCRRPRRMAR